MPTLPSPIWLLTVYGYNELTRLDEYKARITSTFGSILKMDSTKKEWGQLVVRLDIWHLMRNVAGSVTTERAKSCNPSSGGSCLFASSKWTPEMPAVSPRPS
ncbi:hypothetical protein JOQ06_023826, partial [Pogonophryne albipinna]